MAKQKEYTDEEIAAALGKAIRSMRKELGLTQSNIYNEANLERNTLQKYDSGKISSPKMANLIKIAEVMNTTPGTLIDRAYAILQEEAKDQ